MHLGCQVRFPGICSTYPGDFLAEFAFSSLHIVRMCPVLNKVTWRCCTGSSFLNLTEDITVEVTRGSLPAVPMEDALFLLITETSYTKTCIVND